MAADHGMAGGRRRAGARREQHRRPRTRMKQRRGQRVSPSYLRPDLRQRRASGIQASESLQTGGLPGSVGARLVVCCGPAAAHAASRAQAPRVRLCSPRMLGSLPAHHPAPRLCVGRPGRVDSERPAAGGGTWRRRQEAVAAQSAGSQQQEAVLFKKAPLVPRALGRAEKSQGPLAPGFAQHQRRCDEVPALDGSLICDKREGATLWDGQHL